jgi:uncharacterized UPF0146 family protein
MGVVKQGEGVHVVAVSIGFELRIATALSDRGVGISSRSSTSSNIKQFIGMSDLDMY